jgi:hypothetical protein
MIARPALCILLLALAACQSVRVGHREPVPSYHAATDGVAMRRVAVLPLYAEHPGASLTELDSNFQAELAKTSAFEIVAIDRATLEAGFGQRQISSVEPLPADLLPKLSAKYGVDGVLLTDVTHYFPYRPIAVGVRCKLIDARSGRIEWAFDHLFDSGNPAIADAARRFYIEQSDVHSPIGNDGTAILQSPSRFSKYVAHEAYRSMVKTDSAKPRAQTAEQ